MDGAVAALIVLGSLTAAHELIRRGGPKGSLSLRSIPLVVFGYVLDEGSVAEVLVRYMGAKVFENRNEHYAFHVGMDGTTPFGHAYLKNNIKPINMNDVYQVELTPTDLILHDGPIHSDQYGELIRFVHGGQKNFRAVLESIRPDQMAVTVIFPRGVEPTMENVSLAKIGLISGLSSDAFDGSRAYGWLLCDIGKPHKIDMRW